MGLAALAACATSAEEVELPGLEPDAAVVDPGRSDAAGEPADDAGPKPRIDACNEEGWCKTTLPDAKLVMRDIWPLEDGAFAIADGYNTGIKVLEWTSADSTWRYIDDNRQNEVAFAEVATKIWAPNRDEVFYTVLPGLVFHGRRPVPPETEWSWSSAPIEDRNVTTLDSVLAPIDLSRKLLLGVWGTGSDVYAWHGNTVYRADRSGGAVSWVAEYVADDVDSADSQLYFTAMTRAQGGDTWLVGSRRAPNGQVCAVIDRKTSAGYQRVVDGTPPSCAVREGSALTLGSVVPRSVDALAPNHIVFRGSGRSLTGLKAEGAGYVTQTFTIPDTMIRALSSVWVQSPERVWLAGESSARYGVAVTADHMTVDGGVFEISSTASNGAPALIPNQIRGTSATNLWIVGDRYALHKTTP